MKATGRNTGILAKAESTPAPASERDNRERSAVSDQERLQSRAHQLDNAEGRPQGDEQEIGSAGDVRGQCEEGGGEQGEGEGAQRSPEAPSKTREREGT